jgi:hypothetical protein
MVNGRVCLPTVIKPPLKLRKKDEEEVQTLCFTESGYEYRFGKTEIENDYGPG